LQVAAAVELDATAAACYAANFGPEGVTTRDVCSIFDGALDDAPTQAERAFTKRCGGVTFLLGGPPCQGHSDFNNYSRRRDSKNELFLKMARAAQVLEPECVVIENVPASLHDTSEVVARTADALAALGYAVSLGVVALADLGVPQRRKRLLVLATRRTELDVAALAARYATPARDVRWAIGDLERPKSGASRLMDIPANSSPDTLRRIDYLFENGLYDLPDSQRPACHRDKPHSYKSIYGRLSWENPAQTITRGFYSMCMGRYVHPSQRRTLTAREAARLQFFPDYFDFSAVAKRSDLATIIGNAVPMKLPYLAAREFLQRAG
jgi:DNA (cytosine-5)-methyltransferase 1